MPCFPITSAPRDGTEIIVWDRDGNASLAAWCLNPAEIGSGNEDEPHWYRRAEGDWDLFDGFGLQWLDPVTWAPLPREE